MGKVRFQGHVDSTPPDHLGAMLHVAAMNSFTEFKLDSLKQPAAVQKKVEPVISKWAFLLSEFYGKCDCLEGADIVVASLRAGIASAADTSVSDATRDCVLVGFLMAIREKVEVLEDQDLLTACRKLGSMTKVLQ